MRPHRRFARCSCQNAALTLHLGLLASAADSCCIFTLAVRQPPVFSSCLEIYYSCVTRYNTKQVFTAEQELSWKNYLITSAITHYGLTRITPFLTHGKKISPRASSKHWLHFFRCLEYVNTFFDNLEQAMAQLGKNYSPSNIYNLILKRSLFFCQNKKVQIIQR